MRTVNESLDRLESLFAAALQMAPADRAAYLDEALTQLAAADPSKAELVRLRYFAGLTLEQAAELLGISRATADRHWAFARAWLYDAMTQGHDNP